jgi:hypothetical protein
VRVSIRSGLDGSQPARPDPVGRMAGTQQERRATRTTCLAIGTLACPACDAPVALTAGPRSPTDALGCPFCGHAGVVREFLSLAAPSRPARVEIRVVQRHLAP